MATKTRLVLLAAAVSNASIGASSSQASPQLSPIWGNDAVIQRDRPILVEGQAKAGEKVTVTLGDQSASGLTGKDGRFAITLPAMAARAEPLTLKATGADGTVTQLNGLAVGDVWFCSGQSNMELTVDRALDTWNQVQSSKDDLLRMITIPKATDTEAKDRFSGPVSWKKAAPDTTGGFSAACYYMARELRKTQSVPIGLIHASWGGTTSRPWLSPEGARASYPPQDLEALRIYKSDPLRAVTAFAPNWEDWYMRESGGQWIWGKPDSIAWNDVPKISAWTEWKTTPLADNPVATVWLRKTINLTADQIKGDATLSLGVIDDRDMTWVNGKAVGNNYGWDFQRNYRVPSSYLKPGANEILIAASNEWGAGGFGGDPDALVLATGNGQRIPLASGWRFAISSVKSNAPTTPWDRQSGIGVIHNAMVAPIGHYAAKGVAWYQGESDIGIPGYAGRLKALIAGWRAQFGAQARVLVVQLANSEFPQLSPAASNWADLREEQRNGVMGDNNAALVTAIDIGERTDYHPANKNELGRRLALAASGGALPQPVSAKKEGKAIRVLFSNVQGKLNAWSGAAPLGFELCGKGQASCRYASARIDGSAVILVDDGQPITRVRYGWADNPIINLYDDRPLPPPSFELAVIN